MKDHLSELQRKFDVPDRAALADAGARLERVRDFWRRGLPDRARASVGVAAQIAFPVAFAALYGRLGDDLFSLAVIPVGLAAWSFGVTGGITSIALQLALRAVVIGIAGSRPAAWPEPTTAALLGLAAVWFGFVRSLRVELLRRAREAEALSAATGLLVAGTAGRETLLGILTAAMSVVPSTVASFIVPTDDGQHLRVVAILGATEAWLGRSYPVESGISGRAWRTASLIRVDHVARDPDYLPWTPSTRSALAVPVLRAGELRGLIYFEDVRPSRYRERDVRVMRAFADHAAVALESERIERELERLALFDPLTGLPNRNQFSRKMRAALAEAVASRAVVAVVLLDIDHFRDINNTFGHAFGDALLRQVGRRLRADADPLDEVARLGADEFALLLRSDPIDALRIAETMRHALEIPFDVEGQQVVLTGSAGISFFPEHGRDDITLLRRGQIALDAAKATSAGATIYAAAIDASSPARVAMGPELRRAITDELLTVQYQPIVPLRSGRPFGAEALVRWTHPVRGPIPPSEFVPVAESSGLIKLMTELVLDRATADATAWRVEGRGLEIAVNVSMRNLRDAHFVNTIRRQIARHDLDPARLCLEITESVVMADADHTLVVLRHLREIGVRIAIDDFGTGYSSLGYLRRLPIDTLKIDRGFVAGLSEGGQSESIVRATIELAHALGLLVVAEGVETDEQLNRLRDLGCDRAQGFGIGRPMRASDLATWLDVDAKRYRDLG